nr:alcohol dehydrogenase catalytic domain-containing protein [Propionibacteriales bacterium]
MKAFEVRPGDGPDSLCLVERPEPAMRPDEVRVRIRAVSLNYRDLMVLQSAPTRTAPVVPCSDGVGEVVEVGSAVRTLRVGARVAAAMLP